MGRSYYCDNCNYLFSVWGKVVVPLCRRLLMTPIICSLLRCLVLFLSSKHQLYFFDSCFYVWHDLAVVYEQWGGNMLKHTRITKLDLLYLWHALWWACQGIISGGWEIPGAELPFSKTKIEMTPANPKTYIIHVYTYALHIYISSWSGIQFQSPLLPITMLCLCRVNFQHK